MPCFIPHGNLIDGLQDAELPQISQDNNENDEQCKENSEPLHRLKVRGGSLRHSLALPARASVRWHDLPSKSSAGEHPPQALRHFYFASFFCSDFTPRFERLPNRRDNRDENNGNDNKLEIFLNKGDIAEEKA